LIERIANATLSAVQNLHPIKASYSGPRLCAQQGCSQEFCSGGASHWRRQISNFSNFAQRSFWCHWSISDLLQQDMTSNIFYQSVSINFNKDKKTFAFAVIIIKQLLTKQFSMNIQSSGKRSAV